MEPSSGKKRVRVPNFTPQEKSLLTLLIKKRSIVLAKQTDGNTLLRKKTAWDLITKEFNCRSRNLKRNTITLKRAWDNIKAASRKARASKPGNGKSTGDESFSPLSADTMITIVGEAAPNLNSENSHEYDSEFIILNSTNTENQDKPRIKPTLSSATPTPSSHIKEHVRKRLKKLEIITKMNMKILKEKLETQEIKKRAAQLEEETNKILLEKAKLELDELKKKLYSIPITNSLLTDF